MQPPTFLTTDYLDILYHNRNKAYGGYELRKHYEQRAIKSLVALLVCLAFVSAYALYQHPAAIVKAADIIHPTIDPIPYNPTIVQLPKPKPAAATPTDAAIKKFTPLKVTADNQVIANDLPDIKDLKDALIGAENRTGDATNSDEAGSKQAKGDGSETTIVSSAPGSSVLTFASEMPSFNGDLMGYLGRNLRYPEAARDAGVEGRVVIQFIVDEAGTISNAKVLRGIGSGCDEEALRVVNRMPHWKEGKQNGKPVKVLLTLPVIFQLE